MAGYSPRSLVEKLGIKEGDNLLFVQAPADFKKTLGPLPEVSLSLATSPAGSNPLSLASLKTFAKKSPFDFIHAFCREEAELVKWFSILKSLLAPHGMLWISWPKGKSAKSSKAGAHRPFNETPVREIGLAGGLVDVKVCAVDETWSGLKFMFRRKDRPK